MTEVRWRTRTWSGFLGGWGEERNPQCTWLQVLNHCVESLFLAISVPCYFSGNNSDLQDSALRPRGSSQSNGTAKTISLEKTKMESILFHL